LVPVNLKEQKGEEREPSEEVQKRIEKSKMPAVVFVNIDLSQSDHFKSEPLLP
jgi:hypothetical protein